MRLLAGTVFCSTAPESFRRRSKYWVPDCQTAALPDGEKQAFSAALIQTLEACLQSTFTPDVREAWQALCSLAGQYLTRRVPELSLAAA